MILQKLKIELQPRYRPDAGQYCGVAEFDNEAAKVALKLTPEMCEKIFVICADSILSVAKEAAQNLTRNVIEREGK